MLLVKLKQNTPARIIPKKLNWSIGIAIPFQPSMQAPVSINSVFELIVEMVREKLHKRYDENFIDKIIQRISGILKSIDHNSHRKSLAIILTLNDEKIIYLDYFVKPVVLCNRVFSWIDLVMYDHRKPHYFILNFDGEGCTTYEYFNERVFKISRNHLHNNAKDVFFNKVLNVIPVLTTSKKLPIFVCGKGILAKDFYSFTFQDEIVFRKIVSNGESVNAISNSILSKWNGWQSKAAVKRIQVAEAKNQIIWKLESIMQAIKKKTDGSLVVHIAKRRELDNLLKNPDLFRLGEEWNEVISLFLKRGNQVEIVKNTYLHKKGGITLLQNSLAPFDKHLITNSFRNNSHLNIL